MKGKKIIGINNKEDKAVAIIIILVCIIFYIFFSKRNMLSLIYLIAIIANIFTIFIFARIKIFSGIGLYCIFILVFVQIGVLQQGYYYQVSNAVIYALLFYTLIQPFCILILTELWQKKCKYSSFPKFYISQECVSIVWTIGVLFVLVYFSKVGIPMLANDAENYRVTALAGRGHMVVIASACMQITVLLTENVRKRIIRLLIALVLMISTGYRGSALILVLVYFLTYYVAKGKRYLVLGGATGVLLVGAYSVLDVIRRGGVFQSFDKLFNPFFWRMYVNTSNFNVIVERYPKEQFMHGTSFIQDILILLPGPQNTFMTDLKTILNYDFAGGSLTPSVFGEGYYNFGVWGIYLWPIVILIFVFCLDRLFKHCFDIRVYFLLGVSITGFSTSSMMPMLLYNLGPLIMLYFLLVMGSKIINKKLYDTLLFKFRRIKWKLNFRVFIKENYNVKQLEQNNKK